MSCGTASSWTSDLLSIRYDASGRGHYESFYIKANHPEHKLGLWLKFNLLEPVGRLDGLEGELWGVWLDGERGQHTVVGATLPKEVVEAPKGERSLRLGDAVMEWRGDTLAERAQVSDGDHTIAWDIRLEPQAPQAVLYPSRWMYDGGFPKKKVVTSIPQGRLEGWIEVDGERHQVDGWEGLHGHNWGQEHAFRYAYGNGVFPDSAYVDGFSAKLKMGPAVTPYISLFLVRLPDGRELPFNRPAKWLAGRPRIGDLSWEIDLPGPNSTRAHLTMKAEATDAVGLRYRYPDGRVGFCVNTKFARGTLQVKERDRIIYEDVSERCELETFGPKPVLGIPFSMID